MTFIGNNLRSAAAVLVAASALVIATPAPAFDWVGGSGAWEDGVNWAGGNPPIVADPVAIQLPVTVTSSGPLNEARDLVLDAALEVSAGVLDILGDIDSSGAITVDGGELEANFLNNLGDGELVVTGSSSKLDIVVEFTNEGVAAFSSGSLSTLADIDNKASMSATDAAVILSETMINDIGAEATFSGADTVLDVEDNITNAGQYSILAGASVAASSFVNYAGKNVDDAAFAADSLFVAALGTVDLSGSDTSYVIAGNITNQGRFTATAGATAEVVSIGNENVLEILDGAEVDVISILNDAGASISVRDTATRLTLSDNLQSAGDVVVELGGTLETLSIGSSKTVTVKTGGSVVTESITNESDGTMSVDGATTSVAVANSFNNHGKFTASNTADVGAGSFSNTGMATVDTGAVLTTTTLVNAAGAEFDVTGPASAVMVDGIAENRGTMSIRDGATVAAGAYEQYEGTTTIDAATLGAAGSANEIHGGTLTGIGSIGGALHILTGGTLDIGLAADTTAALDVAGNATFGGTWLVEIAGLAAADFDRVLAGGVVTAGGTLEVSLLGGFSPVVGDVFDIALGTGAGGAFAATLFPVFDGRTFETIVGADFIRLAVVNAVPLPPAFALLIAACGYLGTRRRYA